jgi:hypothetical protein
MGKAEVLLSPSSGIVLKPEIALQDAGTYDNYCKNSAACKQQFRLSQGKRNDQHIVMSIKVRVQWK